jgi:hypothetical protein
VSVPLVNARTCSCISGIDTEVEGLAVELFVLHPAGYDGPSRSELPARPAQEQPAHR